MLRTLALLKSKHVKNVIVLDPSILDWYFGTGKLYGKAAMNSQKKKNLV